MTVRRDRDAVLLEGICPVEDAEILMQELLSGATSVDWSGCTELHTACVQVLMAAGRPLCGTPENGQIAKLLGPIVAPRMDGARTPAAADPEIAEYISP